MNSAEKFVGVFCNQPVPYTDFYRFLFSREEKKKTNLYKLILFATFIISWGSKEKTFQQQLIQRCMSVSILNISIAKNHGSRGKGQ